MDWGKHPSEKGIFRIRTRGNSRSGRCWRFALSGHAGGRHVGHAELSVRPGQGSRVRSEFACRARSRLDRAASSSPRATAAVALTISMRTRLSVCDRDGEASSKARAVLALSRAASKRASRSWLSLCSMRRSTTRCERAFCPWMSEPKAKAGVAPVQIRGAASSENQKSSGPAGDRREARGAVDFLVTQCGRKKAPNLMYRPAKHRPTKRMVGRPAWIWADCREIIGESGNGCGEENCA
jgi:hypothetical protein